MNKAVLLLRNYQCNKVGRTFTTNYKRIVDLRSDTVTQPCSAMLHAATRATTGDDVMGEDPTVKALEIYAADMFGKERALYLPTGTMANICAIMAHCHHNKSSEMIIGRKSHINLYEGGGYANLAGVSCKQIPEDENAMFAMDDIKDVYFSDNDDHYAKSTLICLENTHNMLGGVALPASYISSIGRLAKERDMKVHIDGARIMNAAVALGTPPSALCEGADSVSICLSKGLGAPMGSLLVGEAEFIRLARRARKRLGGGMRQVGVIASMGMHALKNNVDRMVEDHSRAQRIASELNLAGFLLPRDGKVDTNIIFFALPENSKLTKEELAAKLELNFGVKISGGYSSGGRMFRLVLHMDIDEEGVDTAIEGIISLCIP